MIVLKPASFQHLMGATILEIRHGHALTPQLGSYGATAFVTTAGTFVVYSLMGEPSWLQEVVHEPPTTRR